MRDQDFCPNQSAFIVRPDIDAGAAYDAATARLSEAREIVSRLQVEACTGETGNSMILWGVEALLSDASKAFAVAYDKARLGARS